MYAISSPGACNLAGDTDLKQILIQIIDYNCDEGRKRNISSSAPCFDHDSSRCLPAGLAYTIPSSEMPSLLQLARSL